MSNTIFNELNYVKVLLVEDDLNLRKVIKELIEPYVNEIYEASNGRDGLELFTLNDVSLVISDINMSVMGGTTMAGQIRELDEAVPIIFITAYVG